MKKLIISALVLMLFAGSSFGQLTKIGGGLFYDHRYYFNDESFPDHKLGNPAIFFTAIYELNLPFHIAPRISMFMPNVTKFEDLGYTDKTVITGYSLDVDGHYVFNSLDRFEFYGLAGVNIMYAHRKNSFESIDFNETITDSQTGFGLNLGVGSYMKVKEQFDLYAELKCIVASQVQFVGSVGILLNVGWLSKNQDPGY